MSKSIVLPTVLTEDTWFYEKNKEVLEPHLGKPYISYSSISSWDDYREDFIKSKFVGFKGSDSVYAEFGNFFGEAVENGFWGENKRGFTGTENVNLNEIRTEGGEFEKFVFLDMGEYIFIGFIDRYTQVDGISNVWDFKTGAENKIKDYAGEDYIQVVLYANALEKAGHKIGYTGVELWERTGSHIKPPLNISGKMFPIPLKYSKERVKFAIDKLKRSVVEISDCYKTYIKIFN